MNIGEAVKERIIELCRERDISINKLCNMSGVTQSTVNTAGFPSMLFFLRLHGREFQY